MKKNKKLIVLLVAVLLLTGCTQRLTTKDNKSVINKETGQTLTKNIICQPRDKKTIALYEKNKIELKDLPKCSEFVPSDGGYEDIWTSVFVKPLAFLIIFVGSFVKNYGLAIMIAGLLIRVLLIPVTRKSVIQSENMKKVQPEMKKLEKKYEGKKDKESQMKKSQEMMAIYKQNNVSLFSGCIFALIQLPLFLAFYEAINRTPAIFEGSFLTLQLGTNTVTGIANGNYLYILIIALVIGSTYYSLKMSQSSMNPEQEKQMKITLIFMLVFMSFASLYIPTATAIYWITSSLFTIGQNLIVKRKKKNNEHA